MSLEHSTNKQPNSRKCQSAKIPKANQSNCAATNCQSCNSHRNVPLTVVLHRLHPRLVIGRLRRPLPNGGPHVSPPFDVVAVAVAEAGEEGGGVGVCAGDGEGADLADADGAEG